LATDETSGPITAALSDGYASRVKEVHTAVALAPTAIGANVKAGPVVNRSDYRRRCGLDGHISGGCGGGHAGHCYETNRSQQKVFHVYSVPIGVYLSDRHGVAGVELDSSLWGKA
jgi:hypothetical protein